MGIYSRRWGLRERMGLHFMHSSTMVCAMLTRYISRDVCIVTKGVVVGHSGQQELSQALPSQKVK